MANEVYNLRNDHEEVEQKTLRNGERIGLIYRSSQSGNHVVRRGVVEDAHRHGTETKQFVLNADNGTRYSIDQYGYVENAGPNSRRLSDGTSEVYRLEALDLESWEEAEQVGAVHIKREVDEVFDCPFCRASNAASVNSVNENNVTVSCGQCREVNTIPSQPVEITLKLAR